MGVDPKEATSNQFIPYYIKVDTVFKVICKRFCEFHAEIGLVWECGQVPTRWLE